MMSTKPGALPCYSEAVSVNSVTERITHVSTIKIQGEMLGSLFEGHPGLSLNLDVERTQPVLQTQPGNVLFTAEARRLKELFHMVVSSRVAYR